MTLQYGCVISNGIYVCFRILFVRPTWDYEIIKQIAHDINIDMVIEFGTRLLQNLNVACLVDGTTNPKMVNVSFIQSTKY